MSERGKGEERGVKTQLNKSERKFTAINKIQCEIRFDR